MDQRRLQAFEINVSIGATPEYLARTLHAASCIFLPSCYRTLSSAKRTCSGYGFWEDDAHSCFDAEYDPHESDLWLKALPTMRPLDDEEVTDGGPLRDEAEAVITFLDDCVQRCIKTPYRYLEDVCSLANLKCSIGPKLFIRDVSQLFTYDNR